MQDRKIEATLDALEDISKFERIRKKNKDMRKWVREGTFVQKLLDGESEERQRNIEEDFDTGNEINYDEIIEGVIQDVKENGRLVEGRPEYKRNRPKKVHFEVNENNAALRKRGGVKPAWAKTEAEVKGEEEEEDEDVLDFMDNFDFKDFLRDVEVKHILSDMKSRVQELEGVSPPEKSRLSQNYLEGSENRVLAETRKLPRQSSMKTLYRSAARTGSTGGGFGLKEGSRADNIFSRTGNVFLDVDGGDEGSGSSRPASKIGKGRRKVKVRKARHEHEWDPYVRV